MAATATATTLNPAILGMSLPNGARCFLCIRAAGPDPGACIFRRLALSEGPGEADSTRKRNDLLSLRQPSPRFPQSMSGSARLTRDAGRLPRDAAQRLGVDR